MQGGVLVQEAGVVEKVPARGASTAASASAAHCQPPPVKMEAALKAKMRFANNL
jgi:hypothetical protein